MSHKPQDARLKCNTSRSISYKSQEARFKLAYVASVSVRFRSKERPRLQNSPYLMRIQVHASSQTKGLERG